MAMLDVKNLSISFGGLKAVDDFSITIEKGQLYGLIGPNDYFQPFDGRVQAGWRTDSAGWKGHYRSQGNPDQSGRHRENLPEYPSVQGAERA